MDFKGQLWCERVFQVMIAAFGIVGFIIGYIQQDFRYTFQSLATGGAIAAVICLPDWPWWNRHPINWLPVDDDDDDADDGDDDDGGDAKASGGEKEGQKKKKKKESKKSR